MAWCQRLVVEDLHRAGASWEKSAGICCGQVDLHLTILLQLKHYLRCPEILVAHSLELGVLVVEGLEELVHGGGGVPHIHQHPHCLFFMLYLSNKNVEIHDLENQNILGEGYKGVLKCGELD